MSVNGKNDLGVGAAVAEAIQLVESGDVARLIRMAAKSPEAAAAALEYLKRADSPHAAAAADSAGLLETALTVTDGRGNALFPDANIGKSDVFKTYRLTEFDESAVALTAQLLTERGIRPRRSAEKSERSMTHNGALQYLITAGLLTVLNALAKQPKKG